MKSSPCSKGLRPHQSFSKQHLSANLFPLSPSLPQAELEVEYFSGTVCRQGFGSCHRSCSPEAKFRFITCQTLSNMTSSPLFFPQVLLMPIFPFPPSTSQNLYPGESSFIKRRGGEGRFKNWVNWERVRMSSFRVKLESLKNICFLSNKYSSVLAFLLMMKNTTITGGRKVPRQHLGVFNQKCTDLKSWKVSKVAFLLKCYGKGLSPVTQEDFCGTGHVIFWYMYLRPKTIYMGSSAQDGENEQYLS